MENNFENNKKNLKEIRNRLLKLHKHLLDWDRAAFEKINGPVAAGKFLEMLLSDPKFSWLRTISTLIVRIDESFDLDDGLSTDMMDGFYNEIDDILNFDSDEHTEFKHKLRGALEQLPDAKKLKEEIENLHAEYEKV